ncbi:MAG TPA: PspA/IM30 family protein [Anaerolineae bacterium]|nr:PspA/IM30 family protein [Anaerolineae bacterium]
MKWFDRVLTALRSAARDLISEEDEIEGDRVDMLIDAAQTRLTVLRDELAQAVAREKRAEIEWRAAWDQANALDANVDSALRAGQDDLAKVHIEQASRAQMKADELSEHYQACVRVTTRLREDVNALQSQLDDVIRRQSQLTDREQSASSLEQINRLKREQRRATSDLKRELEDRAREVSKREDYLAAREEIEWTKK